MPRITKDTKIREVLAKYPQTAEIFVRYGFHCIGCIAANFESIEEGAKAHGITAEELVEELNEAIKSTNYE